MRVLGMGNALVDVIIRVDDERLLDQLRLPKGSMQHVNEAGLAELDRVTAGLDKTWVIGGSAANTVYGLAELGVQTGFIGSAGRDHWGDFYINDLISKSIEPIFCRSDKPTGRANALLTSDGERTFGTYLGAALELGPDFITPELFRGWSLFHIEGYLVQNQDLIRKALELAKAAGCTVSLDLSSYNVVADNIDFLRSVLPEFVDLVFANKEEAYAYTGKDPEEAVDLLAKDCRVAIVKNGEKGAWVKSGDEKHEAPAFKADCIDTTGAGDLFATGFLYNYLSGEPLRTCAVYGNILASRIIETLGPKLSAEVWRELRPDIQKA